MNFDKIVLWGYKNTYNTFGHIFEGFYRAFKYLDKDVIWIDEQDIFPENYKQNTLFITEHQTAYRMPLHDSNFYAVHNMYGGNQKTLEHLKNSNWLHYGVYSLKSYEDHGPITYLSLTSPFYKQKRALEILWATDLLPHEIEANKSKAALINSESKVINWVGSGRRTLEGFSRAAQTKNIKFNVQGSFSGRVSIEDNIRLIQESRFAPTLVDDYQLTHPYIPCRIFKNISYGHFGVTNSETVNKFFSNQLVYESNSYNLFFKAEEELPKKSIGVLYDHMEYIANFHTYINRANDMLKAVELC